MTPSQIWVTTDTPQADWPDAASFAGFFTEGDDPAVLALAQQHGVRVKWLADGPDWTAAPSWLRSACDVWSVECYVALGEALAESVARWEHNLSLTATAWSGQIAICAQGYTQNGQWTEQQVLDAQPAYATLANSFPGRIASIDHFCYNRGDMIASLPIVLAKFMAASPGACALHPVEQPQSVSALARYLVMGVM